MANIPCRDPQKCGVKTHLPGTDALCIKGKQSRSLGGSRSNLTATPRPYKSPTASAHTEHLKDTHDRLLGMSQEDMDVDAASAASYEEVLKLMKDPTIQNLADIYPYGGQKAIERDLHASGYGNDQSEAGRDRTEAATRAMRFLNSNVNNERGTSRDERTGTLAIDPHVREYADARYAAGLEEDIDAWKEASFRLGGRMVQLGVPPEDVEEILPEVSDKVQEHYFRKMNQEHRSADTGELPDWEPFVVAEAPERFMNLSLPVPNASHQSMNAPIKPYPRMDYNRF